MFSPADKLKCVERELKMRREVYPRLIRIKKMSFLDAEQQLVLMEEIVDDYRQWVAAESSQVEMFIETRDTIDRRG